MKKTGKPPLRIVANPDGTGPQLPQPSRALGGAGRGLWRRVIEEYVVEDVAGIELLTARVEEDGEIVRTPTGIKAHPAIKEELACRGFVVRTLVRLGLNFEPLRAGPGRPQGSR